MGVPVVVQWVKNLTVSVKMQVHFLVSLSGLRIQHCHKVQHSSQMWLQSSVAMAVV